MGVGSRWKNKHKKLWKGESIKSTLKIDHNLCSFVCQTLVFIHILDRQLHFWIIEKEFSSSDMEYKLRLRSFPQCAESLFLLVRPMRSTCLMALKSIVPIRSKCPSVILLPWKTAISLEMEPGNRGAKWHMLMKIEKKTAERRPTPRMKWPVWHWLESEYEVCMVVGPGVDNWTYRGGSAWLLKGSVWGMLPWCFGKRALWRL